MTLPVFLGPVTGVAEGDTVVVTPAPALHVTVIQAIPKGERSELVVEVLTEIGVDRIVPWAAARSVGLWRGERAHRSLAKWRATARESGKQSRRAWLPEVSGRSSSSWDPRVGSPTRS